MAGLRTKRLPQLLGRQLLSLLENLTIPAVSSAGLPVPWPILAMFRVEALYLLTSFFSG